MNDLDYVEDIDVSIKVIILGNGGVSLPKIIRYNQIGWKIIISH